jgi:hypothetical protein
MPKPEDDDDDDDDTVTVITGEKIALIWNSGIVGISYEQTFVQYSYC